MRIAFQTSPFERLEHNKETTLLLALEAQKRGYEVFFYRVEDLFLDEGQVRANVFPITLEGDTASTPFTVGEPQEIDLESCDVIFVRNNPVYNEAATFCTYMLEKISDRVLVLNNPHSIRNFPGKIFPMEFPEYIVPQMMASAIDPIADFYEEHGEIILKPLGGYGGACIKKLSKAKGDDLEKGIEAAKGDVSGAIIIAQKFIPEATKGDKRIILFDGHADCAILRKPAEGNFLANINQGGSVEACGLTPHEEELCAKLGPRLRELDLFFVGLDMLGDYITEINVISPGTVRPANRVHDIQLEVTFWDRVLDRLNRFKTAA